MELGELILLIFRFLLTEQYIVGLFSLCLNINREDKEYDIYVQQILCVAHKPYPPIGLGYTL